MSNVKVRVTLIAFSSISIDISGTLCVGIDGWFNKAHLQNVMPYVLVLIHDYKCL